MQIISQNIRGLKNDDRIKELTLMLHRRNIFMACVQETWRTGSETLDGNYGYRLVLSGKKRQTSNRGSLGVGIVLSPKSIDAWKAAGCELHCISARVMAIRLLMVDSQNKTIGLYVVSAYAPIGVAAEIEWNNFFDDIDTCISKKLSNDILIIGSDTNSSMGCYTRTIDDTSYCMGQFGLPYANDAGKRFASHLAINNLLAVTTCFRKNEYATWIHPRSKLKHQTDHFIVKKEHFRYIMDADITQTLIDSDHTAIMCKLRLISRLKKKSSSRDQLIRLDYSQLKSDVERDNFCMKVLEKYHDKTVTNSQYTNLVEAIITVSHSTFSQRKKTITRVVR